MNFSTSQWLSIIVLDVLIKFVFVTAVGLLVTYGFISVDSLAMAAISLSLSHFVCLFLGATLVVAPELLGVQLSPMLRFTASVALANILFVGVLVVLMWPGPNDIPRTADGPIVLALVLAATNLVALLAVAAVGRLIRWLKPRARVDEAAPSA
ncbi:hypothetical protein [Bradyrhizobium sp. URHA0013]|uniref:hypothetical protein n=1 Tax=Bradyrhizobium sp. URHA0013 TaxID=1380352 RepID=UPI0004893ED6|nr:hypothetical protein [Bradyrhizobium sp. URHA0013]